MGAVTYPDQSVTDMLNENFNCLTINLLAKHPDLKEASAPGRIIFAPTFVFTDSKKRELRRYLGWLPPESFKAELQYVLGLQSFNSGDFAGAQACWSKAVETYPDADVTAETLYWSGIAGFLAGRQDFDALATAWNAVRERFPHSTWATRAEPIEDAPK